MIARSISDEREIASAEKGEAFKMHNYPTGVDDQYELVGTRDWSAMRQQQPATATNMENGNNSNGHEQQQQPFNHEYSLPSLDAEWFPVVARRLLKGGGNKSLLPSSKSLDEPDFSPSEAARKLLRSRSRADAMDEIDGRGTFDAREMEDELRSMRREELEDQLGEDRSSNNCS